MPDTAEPPRAEAASPDSSSAPRSPDPEALIAYIHREALPLASFLEKGRLRVVDEDTLEWDFGENTFYLGLMEGNGNAKRLEKLCEDFFRRKVRVKLVGQVKADPSGRKSSLSRQSQKKRKLVKETLEQPQIKEILDIFQGEVVDVQVPE